MAFLLLMRVHCSCASRGRDVSGRRHHLPKIRVLSPHMRLEIDTTVSAPPLANESDSQKGASVDSAEMKSALNQGIKAAQAGNRVQARTSLLHAVELDPRNESGWLWLASISEYPEELLGFL